MSMISVLAVIFIFAISQSSQQPAAPSYYNEFCVADVQATNEMLQEALNWACANGANCTEIKPGHACYKPDTLMHHASYAFNIYYQKNKHNNASCYFKTAAVLNASDPSHGQCKFHLAS